MDGAEAELVRAGIRVLKVAADANGRPDIGAAVLALRAQGLSRLLVEGGGRAAAGFLRAALVERIEWFRAPIILGAEGRPGIGDLSLGQLAAAPTFRRTEVRSIGADLWERYERL